MQKYGYSRRQKSEELYFKNIKYAEILGNKTKHITVAKETFQAGYNGSYLKTEVITQPARKLCIGECICKRVFLHAQFFPWAIKTSGKKIMTAMCHVCKRWMG